VSEPPRRYRGLTWVDPRQGFRASPTQGIGSFALAPIREGKAVEVVGNGLMDEEFRAFVCNTVRFNAIQVDEGLHLVERPEVTERRQGGSLNHSCDSNLWMADGVTLVARTDIAAGEELTVEYALHTADSQWELDGPCNRGSALCRGTVRGSDWRLAEVQDKYRDHFSPFINECIAKTDR
jgi:uncharacterized protein